MIIFVEQTTYDMEKPTTILQKLAPKTSDEFSSAEMYYSVLSSINRLSLTEREIQLIAFTAVKGNISTANVRQEFCEKYESSVATITNIISKLKKQGIFIKENRRIKVNPLIVLDFTKPIVLQITLQNYESRR